MDIIKASGNTTPFKKSHIEQSAIRAGATKQYAKEVAKKVEKSTKQGMNTKQILELTLNSMKNKPEIAARYNLKQAIMLLGPSGFPFEEFLSQVLQNYGYKTITGSFVKGKVVNQEIDIIATKTKTSMIEAKYHNQPGLRTNTKVAMYTYARFLDIKSNPKKKFDEAWLITNTKCTSSAIQYAGGVNLKIIAWKYPHNQNLEQLIEKKGLYPITLIQNLPSNIKHKLFQAKIVLLKDLANHTIEELSTKTKLNKNILEGILSQAKNICKY